LGFRVFALQALWESVKVPKDPLMGFTFLFRGYPNTKAAALEFLVFQKPDDGSLKPDVN